MSLASGRKLQRYTWTALPMPKETIDRVHTLARRCHALRQPIFYSRDGTSVLPDDTIETAGADIASTPNPPHENENDSDSSYSDTASDNSDSDSTKAPDTGSGDETASTDSSYHTSDESESSTNTSDDDGDSSNGEDDKDDNDDDFMRTLNNALRDDKPKLKGFPYSARRKQHEQELARKLENNEEPKPDETTSNIIPDHVPSEYVTQESIDNRMNEQYGVRQRDGLRPRRTPTYKHHGIAPSRPQSYSHLYFMYGSASTEIESMVMTQYSAEKGVKLFKERGVEAILIEMKQLHRRKVGKPIHRYDLTDEQRRSALHYLMFLKEKRCGKIKGRGCANGKP